MCIKLQLIWLCIDTTNKKFLTVYYCASAISVTMSDQHYSSQAISATTLCAQILPGPPINHLLNQQQQIVTVEQWVKQHCSTHCLTSNSNTLQLSSGYKYSQNGGSSAGYRHAYMSQVNIQRSTYVVHIGIHKET